MTLDPPTLLGRCLMTLCVLISTDSLAQVQGPFLPNQGEILFFIGQTSPDIAQYQSEVLSDPTFPKPTGITLYTNVSPGACSGLDGPCTLAGSTNDFMATLSAFPNADVNVGLFLSDSFAGCTNQPFRALLGEDDADINQGLSEQYQAELDALVLFLRDSNRRVFLRIGYEFDGPWNCHNVDLYKRAFRYVKGRIDALEATNIATVWQSASYPIDGNPNFSYDFSNPTHWDTWYPGDDVVDWVGMSTFYFDSSYLKYQFESSCTGVSASPETIYNALLSFSRQHNKPVLISEAAPVAYRTTRLDSSCILENSPIELPGCAEELWTDWYAPFFAYISQNSDVIKGVSYINTNWENIEQFSCGAEQRAGENGCGSGYWGNSKIQENEHIRARFKTALAEMMGVEVPSTDAGIPIGTCSADNDAGVEMDAGVRMDSGEANTPEEPGDGNSCQTTNLLDLVSLCLLALGAIAFTKKRSWDSKQLS